MTRKDLFLLCRNWETYRHDHNIQQLKIIFSHVTGAYCAIGKKDNNIIIYFKGTELKLNDLLTDIMFCKMKIPYVNMNQSSKIKVHFGFLCQYLSIRRELLDWISKYREIEVRKYLFIGHSLGAALATLAILDVQYNYFTNNLHLLQGIVFGSPKLGNKEFKSSFEKRIFQFENIQNVNDLVPKVPLKIMGFQHVNKIVKVDKLRWWLPISIVKHMNYEKYVDDKETIIEG